MNNFYFEPINNLEWNLFENITYVGYIDTYIATSKMQIGDYLFLYLGNQDNKVKPGVYAIAEIIKQPYIFNDKNYVNAHCYNRLSVDAKIIVLSKDEPIISKNVMKTITNQFRTAHIFGNKHYNFLSSFLNIKCLDRLEKVIQRIDKFNKDRDWDKFHSPVNLAKSISIEANELLECFQWNDTDFNIEDVKEELADVMNYCLQMAQVLGVDIIDIINAKMDKTEQKYPVDKAKGVSTKYNKL